MSGLGPPWPALVGQGQRWPALAGHGRPGCAMVGQVRFAKLKPSIGSVERRVALSLPSEAIEKAVAAIRTRAEAIVKAKGGYVDFD